MMNGKVFTAATFVDSPTDGELVSDLNKRLNENLDDIERHRFRIQNLFTIVSVVSFMVGAYSIGFLLMGLTSFFIGGSLCFLLSALSVLVINKYDDRKSKLYNKTSNEIHAELTRIITKYSFVTHGDQEENLGD